MGSQEQKKTELYFLFLFCVVLSYLLKCFDNFYQRDSKSPVRDALLESQSSLLYYCFLQCTVSVLHTLFISYSYNREIYLSELEFDLLMGMFCIFFELARHFKHFFLSPRKNNFIQQFSDSFELCTGNHLENYDKMCH